ncbi:succinylglutamate desuccinylase/aspartoacylase family protein [Chelatococcus asaccharovorans]|uniref:Succinylglutamate desuccinylase/Aspartoacylase catalytic domain-containing protein n=1 Tax=Chelatococcus asaccharovorans TaxID=28210 RepID=A0A2V3UI67_9HYPH|nr:succinylglutamate desuccinylase/aspartoacylase family protein [Chelatococcus asaccharovorans]MBS7706295.1 succinylglutamate desuccinylase/aspartoacylase family protein [Chelatococcus asaccharovorans]PXW65065.1 hypothetical protein C7450_101828 [Chelatococcus asaccharovorans]
MPAYSRITCEVPLTEAGRFDGNLRLPFSSNQSAYGWQPIPITVLRHGNGPTVLLSSGIHGDEYEGQLAMTKFLAEISVEQVQGTIIVMPAVNAPAVKSGIRLSTLDHRNLNRSFPGNPDGSPTEMLAHYIEYILLPRCDFIIDLHSGGSSLLHSPCTLMRLTPDLGRRDVLVDAVRAFGAPLCLVKAGQPNEEGLLDRGIAGAAERCGKPLISSELGGGGTVSTRGLAIAERGIRRTLAHLGVLTEYNDTDDSQPVRLVELGGDDYFVFASADGVYEPLKELGDVVAKGEPAARIWFPEAPTKAPVIERFRHDGLVICQRSTGRTSHGDCLYHLAIDINI